MKMVIKIRSPINNAIITTNLEGNLELRFDGKKEIQRWKKSNCRFA